ncbi:SRPBCC family protein [Agromyces atrinae]|uniref:Putative membrane protein n=1 Tax=Agromyces atrinae TaxID=592376 RepID=A0A4Q2M830_9MICO|nr:SRPBCC family protein [Agromyces atrinae]MCI2959486.1 SRPBCC family protein [Agromyces atrinae]NYD68661.1 putative membrane protein [Agromyces atrinae]RXZ86032.1 SRPBCC family protein [Agromyces atrinae]
MPTTTSDIQISAPISSVYNQWTQFEDFPAFMSGVESITQIDDTTTHWTVKIAGIEREFDAVITEQNPDERIAWKSTEGEDHAGVVTFHRIDDATTLVRLQLDWTPRGAIEHIGALLQVDDIEIGRDLKKFKELIESNGFETGAWRGSVDRATDETGR